MKLISEPLQKIFAQTQANLSSIAKDLYKEFPAIACWDDLKNIYIEAIKSDVSEQANSDNATEESIRVSSTNGAKASDITKIPASHSNSNVINNGSGNIARTLFIDDNVSSSGNKIVSQVPETENKTPVLDDINSNLYDNVETLILDEHDSSLDYSIQGSDPTNEIVNDSNNPGSDNKVVKKNSDPKDGTPVNNANNGRGNIVNNNSNVKINIPGSMYHHKGEGAPQGQTGTPNPTPLKRDESKPLPLGTDRDSLGYNPN
ncbi:MAG: hypothetical protein ACK4PR_02620 [Gammaproteobacteria bacterium]